MNKEAIEELVDKTVENVTKPTQLDRAKEEAIVMVVYGSVIANNWVDVLRGLYRKTVNPLTKNGKPKTTPYEDKLKKYEDSTGNFLKYIGWKWDDTNTPQFEAIAQLTEVTLMLTRLPIDERATVYKDIQDKYEKIYEKSESNS